MNDGSMNSPIRTFAEAMSRMANSTLVLFNRGETWNIADGTTIGNAVVDARNAGIGAYGSGNEPVIQAPAGASLPVMGGNWDIVDLTLTFGP